MLIGHKCFPVFDRRRIENTRRRNIQEEITHGIFRPKARLRYKPVTGGRPARYHRGEFDVIRVCPKPSRARVSRIEVPDVKSWRTSPFLRNLEIALWMAIGREGRQCQRRQKASALPLGGEL